MQKKEPAKPTDYEESVSQKIAQLDKILQNQDNLLIVLHNNPDPDALASGLALQYFVEKRYQLKSRIVYGGIVGRAENKALIRECHISLKDVRRTRFSNFSRVALVDTQPGAGNNSLPRSIRCHFVLDHHAEKSDLDCDLSLIDRKAGATATILVEWISTCGLIDTMSADLATALSYAIKSETQDLGRETSMRDIKAYLAVLQKASMRKLARITHPKLPRTYFITLVKTLNAAYSFRNIIFAHLGDVVTPEYVAEMADILLKHQRMGWSFCSGRYKKNLYVSIRSSRPNAKAGKIIRQILPDSMNSGGHDTFAGGRISLENMSKKEMDAMENSLIDSFVRELGHKNLKGKPLLEES